MATRPKRLCKCGAVVQGRCPNCTKQYDQRRGTAAERGYDSRWAAYAKDYKRRNPLCVYIREDGRPCHRPAEHVDHIKRVSGADDRLFWDEANHQPLCAVCHGLKTRLEEQ